MALRHPETAHWRDSARTPKLFGLDAYSLVPLVIFFVHARLWTFILAIIGIAFFGVLNKFGFTVPIFFRFLRNFFAGPHKVVRF